LWPLLRLLPSHVALAVLLTGAGPAFAQARDKPLPGEFVVIDGRVDAGTYAGWKLFNTACYVCHGVGGSGTDVAPNLVDKIANYRIVPTAPGSAAPDREAEREALLELLMKRERQVQGQPLMPAWDSDDEVSPHVLDLYAYLSARAAGAIGPGKPKRLPPPR
jgi:mono/diheme cytochrome c family protein